MNASYAEKRVPGSNGTFLYRTIDWPYFPEGSGRNYVDHTFPRIFSLNLQRYLTFIYLVYGTGTTPIKLNKSYKFFLNTVLFSCLFHSILLCDKLNAVTLLKIIQLPILTL